MSSVGRHGETIGPITEVRILRLRPPCTSKGKGGKFPGILSKQLVFKLSLTPVPTNHFSPL